MEKSRSTKKAVLMMMFDEARERVKGASITVCTGMSSQDLLPNRVACLMSLIIFKSSQNSSFAEVVFAHHTFRISKKAPRTRAGSSRRGTSGSGVEKVLR